MNAFTKAINDHMQSQLDELNGKLGRRYGTHCSEDIEQCPHCLAPLKPHEDDPAFDCPNCGRVELL